MRKKWVIKSFMFPHKQQSPIYYSIENFFDTWGLMWVQDVNQAMIFKTKKLAEDFLKEKNLIGHVVSMNVNIQLNAEFFKKAQENDKQKKAAEVARKSQVLKDQEVWDLAKAAEEERLKSLGCPVCKTKNPQHHVETKDNGIYGPGYHSRVTADYYVCVECGVHFSDVKKANLGSRPRDW